MRKNKLVTEVSGLERADVSPGYTPEIFVLAMRMECDERGPRNRKTTIVIIKTCRCWLKSDRFALGACFGDWKPAVRHKARCQGRACLRALPPPERPEHFMIDDE